MSAAPDSDARAPGDAQQAAVPRFWLLVVAGPDTGATFASSGERTVIGTHDAADLVLHDPTVSRFHCEIEPAVGRVLLRDLGSLNGTSVNGVGVIAAQLHSGATLTMGRTQVRFDTGAELVPIPCSPRTRFGILVGRSPAMRRAFALLERAAATDTTVLLQGEPGTGKRAAALSVHRESARAAGPFVVVDCGALPSDLLEIELFGEGEGAGAFAAARGGTLLLAEIGELPLPLQVRLWDALERRSPEDARVIAATSRSVRAEVNAKRFRSDLYHRLAGLEVRLPPLRERAGDLPLLVEALRGQPDPDLSEELATRAFSGNVRELADYLDRGRLAAADDDAPIDLAQPLERAREAWIRARERRYAEGLLARHGGDVDAAARAAGVDRVELHRLLRRDGLQQGDL